jgi:cytochrome c6
MYFYKFLNLISFFFLLLNLEKGEKIFQENCSICHKNGNNIIFIEKNLKLETLQINGMNSISAISYQIRNGKNAMPAFGGQLKEHEIFSVSNYVLYKAEKNFYK